MVNPFRVYVNAYAKVTGMDEAGEIILGTYLNGNGAAHDIFDDPFWTKYMMKHAGLRVQLYYNLNFIIQKFVDDFECRKDWRGRVAFFRRFHAEFEENSNKSGYALMHGSNRDVGDFVITGWAEAEEPPGDGSYRINLDVTYVFNDIVDPNGQYTMDKIQSGMATVAMLGKNKSYRLSIGWRAKALVEIRADRSRAVSGYPSRQSITLKGFPASIPGWWM